eukprot:3361779-Amphidinium_carterae.1
MANFRFVGKRANMPSIKPAAQAIDAILHSVIPATTLRPKSTVVSLTVCLIMSLAARSVHNASHI